MSISTDKYMLSNYDEIDILKIEVIDEDCEMYDIEVDEDHTFLVTRDNLISHNCNNMMKALSIPALKSDTPMIVINHIYQNPAQLFATKVQSQGGGLGLQYMGSLNIQCSKHLEKDEDKNSESYYSQTKLNFFTVKNRMVRPSLSCDIWLDFKKGFVRQFESLFDEAVRGGFFVQTKAGWYSCPTWTDPEKSFRKSYLYSNQSSSLWKTFLDKFEEWSNTDLAYKALNQDIENTEDEVSDMIENEDVDVDQEVNIDDIEAENDEK